MKKIVTSLAMILFVGAVVASGTGAFFNDTETSAGNVFTAGAIDLKIDSEQHYNNAVCVPNTDTEQNTTDYWWQLAPQAVLEVPQYPVIGSACDGTWELTDLANGVHKFFNFSDIKPGDEGENTVSIHIDSNESWMCADINVTSNDDVTCNEPELGDDATCLEPDVDEFDGDLAQNLDIFTWLDDGAVNGFQNTPTTTTDLEEGDNIWQSGENPLFSNVVGPLSDAIGGESYALADSGTGFGPLPAGVTQYIGLAWCAGDLTVGAPGVLTCNGSTMNNAAQTDQALLDVTFRVEQARNNPDFLCTPRVAPVVTTLTLAKAVLPPEAALDSAFTLSASGPTPISGIEGAVAVTLAPVTPGVYSLSEVGGPGNELSKVWDCSGNATPEVVDTVLGTATVTIAPGENVICGITNNFPTPG